MSVQDAQQQYEEREAGRARTGTVSVRALDEGVVLTMRPELVTTQATAGFGANYFLRDIPGVSQPPDHPGVPIVFGNPEDVLEEFRLPAVVVKRDNIVPDKVRMHPGMMQYRVPGRAAHPVLVTDPLTGQVVSGFDSYEIMPQALPCEVSYTIRIIARNRGGMGQGARNQAGAIFEYIARIYKPCAGIYESAPVVWVKDSVGDWRAYHVNVEFGVEDETLDVTERTIGYSLDLTVEAELDLAEARTLLAVTNWPTIGVGLHG